MEEEKLGDRKKTDRESMRGGGGKKEGMERKTKYRSARGGGRK